MGGHQRKFFASENFCHEIATRFQDLDADPQRCQKQLVLDELVKVMSANHIRCSVTHNQIRLLAVEVMQYLLHRGLGRYVLLNFNHSGNVCHFLQVNGQDFGLSAFPVPEEWLIIPGEGRSGLYSQNFL